MARIYPKSKRTLECYKQIGAEMRLCKEITIKALCDLGKVLKARDIHKAFRILNLLDEACDKADSQMYSDHRYEINSDYQDVFYGCLENPSRNAVDDEVRKRAALFAKEIIKDIRNEEPENDRSAGNCERPE